MTRRKQKSSSSLASLGICVLIGAGVAVKHDGHAGHAHHAPAHLTSIQNSDLSTPGGWMRAFLAADGMPETRCDKVAVRVWMSHEGGGFGNQAVGNPLNLNPPAGTGWPGHQVTGAWAFPSTRAGLADGLRYTVATVANYPGIQAALRAGDNAQAVLTQVEDSPWAQSHYGYGLTAPPC